MGKNAMNIKKGDTVKVIAGKDKGAEGKVIQVLREEQRVDRRGRQPRQEAHQGRQPGRSRRHHRRHHHHRGPDPRVQRDARRGRRRDPRRLPPRRGHQASPRRLDVRRHAQRPHLAQDRQGDLNDRHRDRDRDRRPRRRSRRVSRPATARRSSPRCSSEFEIANVMQVPGLTKIVVNMGVGEAARDSKLIEGADQRPDRDHRPEADGDQGPQVDRPVQAARGHADRRARHAARRPDVGVPRPAAVAGAAPHPRLPWPLAPASSTAAATTPSV